MKVYQNDDKTHGLTMTFCEGWTPTVIWQQNKILHHNAKLISLLRIPLLFISMYSQNIHCDMLVILTWQLISKANFDNLICLNLPNWLRYYFHEKVRQILHLCHCYLLKGLWFAFCGWFSALRKSDCNF